MLVKEHDADALAQRLLALLRDPQRGARLGAAARSSVLRRFDMQRQIELLENVYEQLASRPFEVPAL
jgi:glycosyltransferase involved in cell wall biosynthesis